MSDLPRFQFDVVVVGGGSAGLGVARAAAERGFSVALFERDECGRATSDNSLRIVHGGFRYLQSLDIPRVIESLRAQATLCAEFPDIVTPLPCVMPLEPFGLRSRPPIFIAQMIFRFLGGLVAGGAPPTGFMSSAAVAEAVPCLRGRCAHGALLWTDALMIDPRALLARWGERCRGLGVALHEHTPVSGVEIVRTGVRVTTPRGAVECRALVNAAGPFVATIARRGEGEWPQVAGYARAFNVIVRPDFVGRYGVALRGEGRLLFAVRRDGHTALGTGYLPVIVPGDCSITESEVATFLIEASRDLPEPLTLSDVVSVDAGLLPVADLSHAVPHLQGRERIVRDGPIITVVSTKYTTFYEQGKRVAKLLGEIVS